MYNFSQYFHSSFTAKNNIIWLFFTFSHFSQRNMGEIKVEIKVNELTCEKCEKCEKCENVVTDDD